MMTTKESKRIFRELLDKVPRGYYTEYQNFVLEEMDWTIHQFRNYMGGKTAIRKGEIPTLKNITNQFIEQINSQNL